MPDSKRNPSENKIISMDERREKQYLKALGKSQKSADAPPLTREVATAISKDIMTAFKKGELQDNMPPLRAKNKKTEEILELPAWRPNRNSNEFYLIGTSISYEYTGTGRDGVVAAYQIRIRLFAEHQIQKKGDGFEKFIVCVSQKILSLVNSSPYKDLVESAGPESGALDASDLVKWYQITEHEGFLRFPVKFNGKDKYQNRVKIGDSIRHADAGNTGGGTLSAFPLWNGQAVGLGARHVVANWGRSQPGTNVLWAGGRDHPTTPLGTYVHPDQDPFHPDSDAPFDAAIFVLQDGVNCHGNEVRLSKQRRAKIQGIQEVDQTESDRRPRYVVVRRGQDCVSVELTGVSARVPAVNDHGDVHFYDGLGELRLPKPDSPKPRIKKGLQVVTRAGDSGAPVVALTQSEDGSTQVARMVGIIVCGNGKQGNKALAHFLPAKDIATTLDVAF